MHPPKFGRKMGVHLYSANVAYLARCGGVGGVGNDGAGSKEAEAGPHFLLQKCFSCFPPLKPRHILWSGGSYSLKNTLMTEGNKTEKVLAAWWSRNWICYCLNLREDSARSSPPSWATPSTRAWSKPCTSAFPQPQVPMPCEKRKS